MSTDSTELTPDHAVPDGPPAPLARSARPKGRFAPAPTILATALIGFAVVVTTTLVAVTASGVPMLSEATSEQFSAALGLVVLRGVVWLVAFCWGGLGIVLVSRRMIGECGGRAAGLAIGSIVCCVISVASALGQVVIPLAANGFSEPLFGDTSVYGAYYLTSMLSVEGAVVAAGLAALALRTAGIRRGFMLVIALICLGYVIIDVTTRGGVPPFGIAFVWLALGIGLRASRVPA